MKKYSLKVCSSLITLLLVAIFLPGCIDDQRSGKIEIEEKEPNHGDDGVSVVLDLDIPSSKESGGSLRALSAEDEKKIESLRVLMFKVEGGTPANETFAYEASVMKHDNEQATVLLKTSENGEKYRAVLIANNGTSGSSSFSVGESKKDVLSKFTFDINGQWKSTSSSDFTPLPMWGESSSAAVIVGAPVTKPYERIHLLRAVARVDVGLCLGGSQFDETANQGDTSGVSDFSLSKVYVHNANNKGNVAKLNTLISEPSIPAAVERNTNLLEYPVSDALSLREIYLAEATNDANLNHTERPFIVIEGQYKNKKTFYRIDYLQKKNRTFWRL